MNKEFALEWRTSILLHSYVKLGVKLEEGNQDSVAISHFMARLITNEWGDVLSMVQAVKIISKGLQILTTKGEKSFKEFWAESAKSNQFLNIDAPVSPEEAQKFVG